MTIKDDIKKRAVEKLAPKYIKKYLEEPAWAWQQVRDAVQGMNSEGKKEITEELINTRVIRAYLRRLAEQEADALLQDNSLDLNELNRIFG